MKKKKRREKEKRKFEREALKERQRGKEVKRIQGGVVKRTVKKKKKGSKQL